MTTVDRQMSITALGQMSGTSLDGVDWVLATFEHTPGCSWQYKIIKAQTIEYDDNWRQKLANAHLLSAEELTILDRAYGKLLGQMAVEFIKNELPPDLIALHGHTIMHRPDLGFTLQIGHGASVAQVARCTVINDFRSADVAAGGQGAPLVPIGEKWLFSHQIAAFINLGGIANITTDLHLPSAMAYDVVPCNMVLNLLSQKLGANYDREGHWGAAGKLIDPLLASLNQLAYYRIPAPKSLGREWVEQYVVPLLAQYNTSHAVHDLLHTYYHHIAYQLHRALNQVQHSSRQIMITGGGAFNRFLLQLIRNYSKDWEIIVPDDDTIQFKEALIFAFLGVLHMHGMATNLPKLTGASHEVIGGAMHKYPNWL